MVESPDTISFCTARSYSIDLRDTRTQANCRSKIGGTVANLKLARDTVYWRGRVVENEKLLR